MIDSQCEEDSELIEKMKKPKVELKVKKTTEVSGVEDLS